MKFCPIFNKTYRLSVYSLRPTKKRISLYNIKFERLSDDMYTFKYLNIAEKDGKWKTSYWSKPQMDNYIEIGIWELEDPINLPEDLFVV